MLKIEFTKDHEIDDETIESIKNISKECFLVIISIDKKNSPSLASILQKIDYVDCLRFYDCVPENLLKIQIKSKMTNLSFNNVPSE